MNKFLFGNAKNKTEVIVRIAIMMALTVLVQFLVGLIGGGIQLLTGSFVNAFLLLSTILCGMLGGICVGAVTPFVALALGLNAQVVLVPFIALANAMYVAIFALLAKLFSANQRKPLIRTACYVGGFVVGAGIKFLFMYFVCVKLIFPLLVGNGLTDNMLTKISAMWGVLQLFTALIGGAVAAAVSLPLLKINLFKPQFVASTQATTNDNNKTQDVNTGVPDEKE